MIAEEWISLDIPTLKPTDKVKQALGWLSEYKLDYLIVCSEGQYIGMVSESILGSSSATTSIQKLELLHSQVVIHAKQHVLEALLLASKYEVNLLPVVDEKGEFVGAIDLKDWIQKAKEIFGINQSGSVMEMSIDRNDYVLSQISRLIESHGAKVTSLFTTEDQEDPLKIGLTIKINKPEIASIVATLERYNYSVSAFYQETEVISKDKDRLELLMKFINI